MSFVMLPSCGASDRTYTDTRGNRVDHARSEAADAFGAPVEIAYEGAVYEL